MKVDEQETADETKGGGQIETKVKMTRKTI